MAEPQAPLYHDLAQGPDGGSAFWLRASDGVRLRMAIWPEGARGTVLLLPGRTEYIEKYGRAAAKLAGRGYGVVTIDWRGQGLSDRLAADKMLGHIQDFSCYQKDLEATLAKLTELNQPGPFYMISHSMGGAIGLRALQNGLAVQAAAFSAPMWGIHFSKGKAPLARIISRAASAFGKGHLYAPSTSAEAYVNTAAFADNMLTRDADSYARMQAQITQHPELALGGPSLRWLDAALRECRALAKLPSPNLPAFCCLGSNEKVVDPAAIHARMVNWSEGELCVIPCAKHEIMMELPATRNRFFDTATALFAANP